MVTLVLLALVVPFVVSFWATFFLRGWATRIGFVDRPGGHKQHARPLALGGGLALIVSIGGTLLIGTGLCALVQGTAWASWMPEAIRPHLPGVASKLPSLLMILAGAAILHVLGLLDDRRPLGPWVKLLIQTLVALAIAGPAGIRAVEALPVPLSIAATVVWIVLITNAFNFLDNMDGLSAGVAAIAAAVLALAAARAGQVFVPVMACVVIGGLMGFLYLNFSPASIIMGDAGSLVVGFLMSVLTILTTYYDASRNLTPLGVVVPLVVLAVPLYDVASVVILRLRLGENPFRGDQRHFSHRLVRSGLSPRGAVLTIYLATTATALPAVVLPQLDWPGAMLLFVQCVCVVGMIAVLENVRREAAP
jgi:UDP-GlcNAc:undecaprenyl-phosphate GlcNAc-1-phosphate transferase